MHFHVFWYQFEKKEILLTRGKKMNRNAWFDLMVARILSDLKTIISFLLKERHGRCVFQLILTNESKGIVESLALRTCLFPSKMFHRFRQG